MVPRAAVQKILDERGIERQTDIWIYPNFEVAGYTAVVGADDDYVYIFEAKRGHIVSVQRTLCLGVRPNGSLIY